MATITLGGKPIQTSGDLPAVGATAPDFSLVGASLAEQRLGDFEGIKVLNIFPSIDTSVCAMSVRRFNAEAAGHPGVSVLNISADLPFAQKRFCGAEGLDGVVTLSTFRSDFAEAYGVKMTAGALAGLCARAVVVVDAAGRSDRVTIRLE
ncbi:MAG: thiol peroxidase [Myxococcales bacterium]|nr:thiol peroxidase [Myxococcales bacterium]